MVTFIPILFLLGLNNIQTPVQPPPGEVLHYAPEHVDVYGYWNLEATVPSSLSWFKELQQQVFVKESPELALGLHEGLTFLEASLSTLNVELGMDLIKDLRYAQIWYRANSGQDGEKFSLLCAVRGDFSESFAGIMAGKLDFNQFREVEATNRKIYYHPTENIGLVQLDGVVLLGNMDLLEERAGIEFVRGDSEQLRRIDSKLADNPAIFFAIEPGDELRQLIDKEHFPRSFTDLVSGTIFYDISMLVNGVDVELKAASMEMYERFFTIADGVVDLLRASQLMMSGMFKGTLAVISPDDPDIEPEIRPLFKHTDALLNFGMGHIGTGIFTEENFSDQKTRMVSIRLRAGHIREIVSPAIPVLMGAMTFLIYKTESVYEDPYYHDEYNEDKIYDEAYPKEAYPE